MFSLISKISLPSPKFHKTYKPEITPSTLPVSKLLWTGLKNHPRWQTAYRIALMLTVCFPIIYIADVTIGNIVRCTAGNGMNVIRDRKAKQRYNLLLQQRIKLLKQVIPFLIAGTAVLAYPVYKNFSYKPTISSPPNLNPIGKVQQNPISDPNALTPQPSGIASTLKSLIPSSITSIASLITPSLNTTQVADIIVNTTSATSKLTFASIKAAVKTYTFTLNHLAIITGLGVIAKYIAPLVKKLPDYSSAWVTSTAIGFGVKIAKPIISSYIPLNSIASKVPRFLTNQWQVSSMLGIPLLISPLLTAALIDALIKPKPQATIETESDKNPLQTPTKEPIQNSRNKCKKIGSIAAFPFKLFNIFPQLFKKATCLRASTYASGAIELGAAFFTQALIRNITGTSISFITLAAFQSVSMKIFRDLQGKAPSQEEDEKLSNTEQPKIAIPYKENTDKRSEKALAAARLMNRVNSGLNALSVFSAIQGSSIPINIFSIGYLIAYQKGSSWLDKKIISPAKIPIANATAWLNKKKSPQNPSQKTPTQTTQPKQLALARKPIDILLGPPATDNQNPSRRQTIGAIPLQQQLQQQPRRATVSLKINSDGSRTVDFYGDNSTQQLAQFMASQNQSPPQQTPSPSAPPPPQNSPSSSSSSSPLAVTEPEEQKDSSPSTPLPSPQTPQTGSTTTPLSTPPSNNHSIHQQPSPSSSSSSSSTPNSPESPSRNQKKKRRNKKRNTGKGPTLVESPS